MSFIKIILIFITKFNYSQNFTIVRLLYDESRITKFIFHYPVNKITIFNIQSSSNTSRLPANMTLTYAVRTALRAYRSHFTIFFTFSLLESKKAPEH